MSSDAPTARLVLVTAPDQDTANSIASQLVEERLAACVNLLPNVQSVYRWEGRVQRETEVLMLIKTLDGSIADLQQRLLGLHPYELPEFVVLKPEHVEARYMAWIETNTKLAQGGGTDDRIDN
ncbi:MAG: periplasmic divalent cation tolerance protein [Planctomycetota bacterium]|jgi:periplasmic divalent cation tolerance protein